MEVVKLNASLFTFLFSFFLFSRLNYFRKFDHCAIRMYRLSNFILRMNEPKSSYAIADFVQGKSGAWQRVLQLTISRSIVILLGIMISKRIGLNSSMTAVLTSSIMTIWIAIDYYLNIYHDYSLFFYSGSPPPSK